MSFRKKLFFSILLALVCAAFLEGTLDYLENLAEFRGNLQRDLNLFADVVALHFGDAAIEPLVDPETRALLALWEGSAFAITRGGDTASTYGSVQRIPSWASTGRELPNGYRLEASLDPQPYQAELVRELRSDLLSDTLLFLLLLAGFAFLLTRFALAPVETLSRTMVAVSNQRSPEPVAVPPGNDELSQLARAYNSMVTAVQELLERERVFTRYASHELRTPISNLRAQLEAYELGLYPLEKVMPRLKENLSRMEEVLGALLTLARRVEVQHDPAPLLPLVKSLVAELPREARARVHLVVAPGLEPVVADGRLLRQALQNLIDNALKYSAGPVTLELSQRNATIAIAVSDHGPGVPASLLQDITKPFFRLSDAAPGTGLGLALVKHIMQALGGRLALENRSEGFCATLVLPAI